ncbi:hypothetical protein PENTCL1PPCAC_23175, partial [Pristionchus entomophagus]
QISIYRLLLEAQGDLCTLTTSFGSLQSSLWLLHFRGSALLLISLLHILNLCGLVEYCVASIVLVVLLLHTFLLIILLLLLTSLFALLFLLRFSFFLLRFALFFLRFLA